MCYWKRREDKESANYCYEFISVPFFLYIINWHQRITLYLLVCTVDAINFGLINDLTFGTPQLRQPWHASHGRWFTFFLLNFPLIRHCSLNLGRIPIPVWHWRSNTTDVHRTYVRCCTGIYYFQFGSVDVSQRQTMDLEEVLIHKGQFYNSWEHYASLVIMLFSPITATYGNRKCVTIRNFWKLLISSSTYYTIKHT